MLALLYAAIAFLTVGVTIIATALGIVFQGKNIAYMVGLAFTVARAPIFFALARFDD